MICLHVQISVSLHIGYIETVHINNQTKLQFVNFWSNEVSSNISYPIMFNKIDGYLDGRISVSSVRYIIKR